MSPILNVSKNLMFDESIRSYEYHIFQPFSNTSYGNNDEIRILVNAQDAYLHLSESFIQIDGTVDSAVTPTDNGPSFLFSEVRLELNSKQIDQVRNVGITSMMKSLVTYSKEEADTMQICGYKKMNFDATSGKWSVVIPLKHWLGFAEDYNKLILNSKIELILIRSKSDKNFYTHTLATDAKVEVKNIAWYIPFVEPSDQHKLSLLNILNSYKTLTIPFRTRELYDYPAVPTNVNTFNWPIKTSTHLERPRFILFALQIDRSESLTKKASEFDHGNLRNVRAYINSEVYPYTALNVNFEEFKYAHLFLHFLNFKKTYYNKTVCEIDVDITSFKSKYSIWVIDCSRQQEAVKTASIDVRLSIEANKNFPEKTHAYCLILSDRLFEYNSASGIVRQM